MRIDFGFPEILLLCGTWLLTSNQFGFGVAACSLGLLGALVRASQRIQKQQQEEQARQKLFQEMENAGEELGQALMSLFKGGTGGNGTVQ